MSHDELYLSKQLFDVLWAAEHRKRHPHGDQPRRHALSVRIGEFDALNTHGSMFEVRCVRCGLAGVISIPDYAPERTVCPRCHHVPESKWQGRGQAGLLPPEKTQPKPLQIVTVDAEDDEQQHEGDPIELSLDEKPKTVVAGEDVPDVDNSEEESDEAEDAKETSDEEEVESRYAEGDDE